MVANWKVTGVYEPDTGDYFVSVWVQELGPEGKEPWRCVAYVIMPSLERYFELPDRIRQMLRQLGTNGNDAYTRAAIENRAAHLPPPFTAVVDNGRPRRRPPEQGGLQSNNPAPGRQHSASAASSDSEH